MAHMQQQIVKDLWLEIDGENGIDVIPADLIVGHFAVDAGATYSLPEDATEQDSDDWAALSASVADYTENREIREITCRKGYGARLSAPGYMDCTPWTVFETEQEAREYLVETYGDEEEDSDV